MRHEDMKKNNSNANQKKKNELIFFYVFVFEKQMFTSDSEKLRNRQYAGQVRLILAHLVHLCTPQMRPRSIVSPRPRPMTEWAWLLRHRAFIRILYVTIWLAGRSLCSHAPNTHYWTLARTIGTAHQKPKKPRREKLKKKKDARHALFFFCIMATFCLLCFFSVLGFSIFIFRQLVLLHFLEWERFGNMLYNPALPFDIFVDVADPALCQWLTHYQRSDN